MRTQDEFGEECKKVIDSDDFCDAELSELDSWTSLIVNNFLDEAEIKWQISRQSINPGRVIKIYDKYLKYLLMMPHKSYDKQTCDQFYWMIGNDPNNDKHSISPDMASAYLLSLKHPGAKILDVRQDDGSCVTRITLPSGATTELHLPPGTLSVRNKE